MGGIRGSFPMERAIVGKNRIVTLGLRFTYRGDAESLTPNPLGRIYFARRYLMNAHPPMNTKPMKKKGINRFR